jgi:hypothetical protein
MAVAVNNKRKYAMKVTVVSALTGRGLHQVPRFEFESFEQDPQAIDKDGKQQFLAGFKERLKRDPEIDKLINGTRYKIRTTGLMTA